jgi:hypothetical protein
MVMVGLNSLTKLFRKTIGPRIEALGIFPSRYYLNRTLEALDVDDIDEAVRMITLARTGQQQNSRWRLVCQQVIFRCRVLASLHEKQIERIKTELELFGKAQGMRERYLSLQKTEGKAREVLRSYERRLLDQLAASRSSSPPS